MKIADLEDLGIWGTRNVVNELEPAKKLALVHLKWFGIIHGLHKQYFLLACPHTLKHYFFIRDATI